MKKFFFLSGLFFALIFCACENSFFQEAAGLFDVEFETNGGSALDSIKTDRIASVPQSAKENCDFEGWYLTSDFSGEKLVFPLAVKENMTLYAKWLEYHTVTFITNGGSQLESVLVTTLDSLPLPERADYEFGGWFTSAGLVAGTEATVPLKIERDTTLYAKWNPLYTLRFETNGGNPIADKKVALLSELPAAQKTDYEFEGWYTTAHFAEGTKVSAPYTLEGDTTLYAKFLATYLLTLETNGGDEIESIRARTVQGVRTPEKSKHSFLGWYLDAEFKNEASFPLELKADTTLYAKWAEDFTVTFECNGGSAVPPVSCHEIESAESCATTKSGQSFAGWFTRADFAEESAVSFPYPVTSDVTFYAKWDKYTWTITYDANGAEKGKVPEAVHVTKGKSFVVSANTGNLAKPGYAFTKWSTSADGTSGKTYSTGQTVTPATDMVLYAQWGKDYGEMVEVEGGTFQFGSPGSTDGATITLNSFQIAKYEVTYELWLEVATWAEENGYNVGSATKGYGGNDQYKSFVPATYISWNEACVWLNAYSEYKGLEPVYYKTNAVWRDIDASGTLTWDTTKNGYRLPTECEWEYAAGGGNKTTVKSTYSGSNKLEDVGWYSTSECKPVGSYKANELGTYDMSGSVAEWCFDWYDSFGSGELNNPIHWNGNGPVYRGAYYAGGSYGYSDNRYFKIYNRGYSSSAQKNTGLRPARNAE